MVNGNDAKSMNARELADVVKPWLDCGLVLYHPCIEDTSKPNDSKSLTYSMLRLPDKS